VEGQPILEVYSVYGRSFSILRIPYSLKLLIQELQVMNVQMRIITEENVDQLLNLSYQSRNMEKLLHIEEEIPNEKIDEFIKNYKKSLTDKMNEVKADIQKTYAKEQQLEDDLKNTEIQEVEELAPESTPSIEEVSPEYPEVSPAYVPEQITPTGSPAYVPEQITPGYQPNDEPRVEMIQPPSAENKEELNFETTNYIIRPKPTEEKTETETKTEILNVPEETKEEETDETKEESGSSSSSGESKKITIV
jgi:hypothetical protein